MSVFARNGNRSRPLSVVTGIVAFGASALLLASCSSPSSSNGSGGSTSAPDEACGPDAATAVATAAPVTAPTAQNRAVTLKIGSILPTTGSLSYLGPPEIAGVNLAVAEINASAPGVLGGNVEVIHRDSGDTTTDIATQSATDLISQGVAGVVPHVKLIA